jgi:hypothetical protein
MLPLLIMLLGFQSPAPSPIPAPLPTTAVFSFGGYGVKADATVGYAQLLSQSSATYSFTAYRLTPGARGNLSQATATLMTGVLPRFKQYGWVSVYGSGLAGGGTTATGATVGSFSLGGIAVIAPPKWTHWAFAIGADEQKSASSKSYANLDIGWVWHQ